MERRRHRIAHLSGPHCQLSSQGQTSNRGSSITSGFNRAGRASEGQAVVAVDRRHPSWRGANLNKSRLSVNSRDHSSPGQSPNTSLETHCVCEVELENLRQSPG